MGPALLERLPLGAAARLGVPLRCHCEESDGRRSSPAAAARCSGLLRSLANDAFRQDEALASRQGFVRQDDNCGGYLQAVASFGRFFGGLVEHGADAELICAGAAGPFILKTFMTNRQYYGTTAKVFHWAIVSLLVIQYSVGWLMPDVHVRSAPSSLRLLWPAFCGAWHIRSRRNACFHNGSGSHPRPYTGCSIFWCC